MRRRPLTIPEILNWADIHREASGKWPTQTSGCILGARFETWLGVASALREGLRSLPGGSSLAQLLTEKRGARNHLDLPPFSEQQILLWADAHHQRYKKWPQTGSGAIADSGGETWSRVNQALNHGLRGMPGGVTLARFLKENRGVRISHEPPALTEEKILQWADAYHDRTGDWPNRESGPIADSPEDMWSAIHMALKNGLRQLPGGTTLAKLLAEKRGVPHSRMRPDLCAEIILVWADAFHQRTGKWPNQRSGPIPEAPPETWCSVAGALRQNARGLGLTMGLSLAELLARERGVRNIQSLPRFRTKEIVRWAKAYHQRTGQWPTSASGSIPEAPGDTWLAVESALRVGCRGFRRGGSSLAKVLAEFVGLRNIQDLPPLSKRKIIAWADAYHERTGEWPNESDGAVTDAPGENWVSIDDALRRGRRNLQAGSSLARLLAKKRGVRNIADLPPLTEQEILQWADLHFQRTGSLPTRYSGQVMDAPGESWAAIQVALRSGRRNLPGQSSLAKLLKEAGNKS
jgi:hypothetical protein